jgi:hypothetical protein
VDLRTNCHFVCVIKEVVRAETLDITEVKLSLYIDRAVAQAVSGQPVTARASVRSQISPSEICAAQSSTGRGFSPEYFFFLLSVPFYQSFTLTFIDSCSYHKDKLAKHGNLPKCNVLAQNGEHWIKKMPPLFSVFICWNNKTVSLTSFGMTKGRIEASQHLVLSDWHLCGETKRVQDFGVFTCTAQTMWNTETYKRRQY